MKEEEVQEPKMDTGESIQRCVQNVCARPIRSARCLALCPRRHRFVCKTFCVLCALSSRMSLVTACMFRAFCTAAEDDPDAWDASDVDMFNLFSEAEGEGEGGEGWWGGGVARP